MIDVGAGPGFVAADLAALVGPSGKVIALERAPHFLDTLRGAGLANVEAREQDVSEPFGVSGADASWCRWVLSFVPDPAATVRHIAAALKPGGIAIFHEYVAYETWRMMPPIRLHERFRSLVEQSWRDSGGEPDIALWLPQWLDDAGFEIVETRCSPTSSPRRRERGNGRARSWRPDSQRLRELGYVEGGRSRGDVASCSTSRPPERTCSRPSSPKLSRGSFSQPLFPFLQSPFCVPHRPMPANLMLASFARSARAYARARAHVGL